jgi:uncharacterized protein with FMN-binding domain
MAYKRHTTGIILLLFIMQLVMVLIFPSLFRSLTQRARGGAVAQTQPQPLQSLADGYYTGMYQLHSGKQIRVRVGVEQGRMQTIEILQGLTNDYGRKACLMIPRIIQSQTLQGVEAVSGATQSSQALLKAVANALSSPREP